MPLAYLFVEFDPSPDASTLCRESGSRSLKEHRDPGCVEYAHFGVIKFSIFFVEFDPSSG